MSPSVHRHLFVSFTALTVLLTCSRRQLAAEETISDKANGFTITVPDGFVPAPNPPASPLETLYCFSLGPSDDGKPHITLLISKMDRTIRQLRLREEQLPPTFHGRLMTTNWQGFEVDEIEVRQQANGIDMLVYVVQIPLKRAAIQVTVAGPVDKQEDLKKLMRTILDGLHGESNWGPSASVLQNRSHALTHALFGAVLLTIGIVFVAIALVKGLRKRKPPTPAAESNAYSVVRDAAPPDSAPDGNPEPLPGSEKGGRTAFPDK
jgi:hypothetical protein